MTLATDIVIGKPTAIMPLYRFCHNLLGGQDMVEPTHQASDYRPGVMVLHNPPAIGLPAWLWITYGPDGPIAASMPHPDEDDDERTWRENSPEENGWSAIVVTFDTSYGYRRDGATASDLHAWLVRELGNYLDHRNLPWKWQNEFTGEWFDGYDGLDSFGNAEKGALR